MNSFFNFFYKNKTSVTSGINNNNIVETNKRTQVINEITEAQYIIEMVISAIHIVKKIITDIRELIAFKQNLDQNFNTHADDFVNVNQQINQLKLELNSIIETYTWKGVKIFKTSDWVWIIDNNKYTWSFNLQGLIDTIP